MMVFGVAGFFRIITTIFVLLYLRFSLDTKIHSRNDLEKALPETPVVAEIPFIPEGKTTEQLKERSRLGESFRIMGTNLNFLLKSGDGGKVLYSTSSVKGEGKTMMAVQAAMAYAGLGKKVLLIGADLRNPQLHKHFEFDRNDHGLSELLSNESEYLDRLFAKSIQKNTQN